MNREKNKHIRDLCIVVLLCLLSVSGVYSQSGSFANTFIHEKGEMAIHNANHNFLNGGAGTLPGIVGTERTGARGFFSFVGTASWSGASDAQHVDGYARTYETGSFLFPIGDNGKYRPAQVSAASTTNPIDAAYYGVDPTSAVTSSLKGGNEPTLPNGTYNSATAAADLRNVSTVEYWDINGATAAKITLTWDATSDIATMTGGDMDKLTIVGWDGTEWVEVASSVDATSILGGASVMSAGSITTDNTLQPNTYDVYTFAALCEVVTPTAQMATPNPICSGDSTTLTASLSNASDTLRWYSDAALTMEIGMGSYKVAPSATTTYYGAATNGICVSSSVSVSVVVNPMPMISSVDSTNPTNCSTTDGEIILNGLAASTSYEVTYTNPAGTPVTFPIPSYSTDASGDLTITGLSGGLYKNIFVKSASGCVSNVIASVDLTPSAPTPGTPNTTPICLGDNSDLSATFAGGTLTWYSDAGLTTSIGTGSPFNVSPTATTTYYMVVENGSCQTAMDSVVVEVATNCPMFPTPDTTINNTMSGTPVTAGPSIDTPTGGSLIVEIIAGFNHNSGTASIDGNGVVTVTPNDTTFVGQDTVWRRVCYILGTDTVCDTSMVIVNNAAPNNVFTDTTDMNTAVVLDTVPALIFEGGIPSTSTSSPNLTVDASGVPTYTPPSGFIGLDTVAVYRCDMSVPMNCDTTTYIVTVLPNNISDTSANTTVNTPVTSGPVVSPGPNVTDNSTANNGTVTTNADGTITYTPDPNFVGTDTVVREICVVIGSDTTCDTVNIVINVAPKYADTSAFTPPNTPVGPLGTPISVMPGSDTTITIAGPSNGTATINADGTITYTPDPNFVGEDTVWRQVCVTFADGSVECATSMVIVSVGINNPDTSVSTPMNNNILIGPGVSGPNVSVTATASNGTSTVNADGTITYTPDPGFVGIDTVVKVVCVTNGGTTTCDTAHLIITVTPDYGDTSASTSSGTPVTVGPTIPVGPNVTVSTEGPSNGSVVVNSDGTLTYTPDSSFVGMDTVRRIVCVISGTDTICDTSVVVYTVGPNPGPVGPGGPPSDTSDVTTPIGTPVTVGGPITPGPGTTVSQTATANNGTVTINGDGTLTYTPNTGFVGTDTITRIICVTYPDGMVDCDTFYITVVVGNLSSALPNYLSPNGDGNNDTWILPESVRSRVTNLNIYNRWGNIVWGNKGFYNNDFSGTHFENSNPLPDGVYYYLMELRDEDEPKSGFIEIMRK